ncbi:MAG: MFS transporter [Nitrospinae bacterium]|nr:MFS transporter [Nitrospinota bacterium]
MTSRAEKQAWRPGDYFDLSVIGLTHGLSDGFSNMLVPVLALIVVDLGLSPFEVGVLLSTFSLGTMIFQYPLSILADNTGARKRILLIGMGVSAASFIAMIWVSRFLPMCALAFLAGAGNSVYHPCGTALAANRFERDRAFAISWHSLGGNLGTSILPLIQAAVAAVAGWRAAVGACAAPAIALLPMVNARFHEERHQKEPETEKRTDLKVFSIIRRVVENRNTVWLAATYTLRSMCTKGMIGFLPLLATSNLGMNTAQIGVAVSLHFGFGMLAKPLMGILYDRWGARAALFWPMTLLGVFVLGLPFMKWQTGFYVLSALTGVVGFVSPIILTAAADFSEKDILASSVGFIYTCHGLSFLAPLLGGWLAGQVSLDASYFCFAIMSWLAVSTSAQLRGKKQRPDNPRRQDT